MDGWKSTKRLPYRAPQKSLLPVSLLHKCSARFFNSLLIMATGIVTVLLLTLSQAAVSRLQLPASGELSCTKQMIHYALSSGE